MLSAPRMWIFRIYPISIQSFDFRILRCLQISIVMCQVPGFGPLLRGDYFEVIRLYGKHFLSVGRWTDLCFVCARAKYDAATGMKVAS